MQNAPGNAPNPLELLVKSQPSSREGIDLFVGEDAATFDWANEKMGALGDRGWLTFFAAVGAILSALAVLWIYPATGYSDDFVAFLEDLTDGNSHLVTLIFGIIFPITHSGLASLRPYGEKIVGARTWRVIFAWPSLCLAYSWITYFVSHAHDGVVLWDGTQIGWLHALAWCINFASFFIYIYITLYINNVHICMYVFYIYISYVYRRPMYQLRFLHRERVREGDTHTHSHTHANTHTHTHTHTSYIMMCVLYMMCVCVCVCMMCVCVCVCVCTLYMYKEGLSYLCIIHTI
jgi:hypothetical protein